MHPTRSAEIVIGNKSIGYLGELNPLILEKLGVKMRILVAEINYNTISKMLNKKTLFKQFAKFPSVERDLALVMDKSVTNGETLKLIKKFSDKSLVSVDLFDIYEGEQLETGKKSMAYRLTFSLLDRSLTMEEVDESVNKILAGLKNSRITLR